MNAADEKAWRDLERLKSENWHKYQLEENDAFDEKELSDANLMESYEAVYSDGFKVGNKLGRASRNSEVEGLREFAESRVKYHLRKLRRLTAGAPGKKRDEKIRGHTALLENARQALTKGDSDAG